MDDEDVAEIKGLLKEIRARQERGLPLPSSVRSLLKAAGVRVPFQVSVQAALLTTFWVAVWFGVIAAEEPSGRILSMFWLYLLIMTPAAALGAALSQPIAGIMFGSVSAVAIILVSIVAN